ncbi:MAG: hypothetical protein AAFV53_38045 [Myxococcota bacterium]
MLTLILCMIGCVPSSSVYDPIPEIDQDSGQDADDSRELNDTGDTGDVDDDGGVDDTGASDELPVDPFGVGPYPVGFVESEVVYTTDYPVGEGVERALPVRVWYPEGFVGDVPVIVVSHGGDGAFFGHRSFAYLGEAFAASGYLSVHISHVPSLGGTFHRWDRPFDVSAVVDALTDETLSLPDGFAGAVRLDRVGHIGHSWGAYTAHAVAGALFTDPTTAAPDARWTFRDARIRAIVALSPQGFDGFGSYDEQEDIALPSTDNSWSVVPVPAYNLVGEAEKDGVAGVSDLERCPACFRAVDWRLFPFARYPSDGDRYLSVVPGQNHSQMGTDGDDAVQRFISTNARLFFDLYLKAREDVRDQIGLESMLEGTDNRRK